MYFRVISVLPYIGDGSNDNPIRPKHAPVPGSDQHGIIGYMQVPSDDGRFAVAEFVAKDPAALRAILEDGEIKAFVKGKNTRAEIETEVRKYKHDFDLDHFGVVIP
jgi:hypothetical protein